MVTKVTPYKLVLPRSGGFRRVCWLPGVGPYPSFYRSIIVPSAENRTVVYGDNLVDWKDRIRSGRNASTNLTATGTRLVKWRPCSFKWASSCQNCAGSKIVTNKGSEFLVGSSSDAVQFPSSNPSSISEVSAKNLAKERFLLNALDKQRRFTGGVFLGELTKSLRMIRSPAKSLFASIVETSANLRKKGKLLPKHRRREFLANSYLEASYGWAPLVSDIQKGAEALAEYNLKRNANKVYVRGSSGVIESLISDTVQSSVPVETLVVYRVDTRIVQTSRVEVKYYGKIVTDPVDSLFLHERYFGLDLSSFVPTAWELIPYSFLVDYFTNIGNVINAWSFQTSQLYWCSRTVARAYRTSYYMNQNKAWLQAQLNSCTGKVEFHQSEELILEKFRIERIADALGDVSTAPSIRFRLPGTSMKWLNIAALGKAKFLKPFF